MVNGGGCSLHGAGTGVALAVAVVRGATERGGGMSSMWVSETKGTAGGEGIERGGERVAVEGGGCSLHTATFSLTGGA